MSVNSSSSSSLPSNSSSINFCDFVENCIYTAGAYNAIAFTITSILLVLPLCISVIYLGFQRWRQQRSGWTMSHSDIFTYNMVVIELMNIVGVIIFCYSVLTRLPKVTMVALFFTSVSLSGQQLFHSLTCVERYLAVVHPVTYLGLKKEKGIRIRNISIGCVWLLCFADNSIQFNTNFNLIFSYCTIAFIFVVISFCSLSVLYVLIRPGPGAGGEGRQRVDQSKMRAFYTIMAILGVLLLRIVGTVVHSALLTSPHVGESEKCIMWFSLTWFTLPSSLVLPLLFLHRAGKLLCCKNMNQ